MKASFFLYFIFLLTFISCSSHKTGIKDLTSIEKRTDDSMKDRLPRLETRLKAYVDSKKINIGVAVIVNSKDTISINGRDTFQMMSVFKFPLALAVVDNIEKNGYTINDTVGVASEELLEDTYSPMLKKYGKRDLKVTFLELLDWALTQSDNNAADILLNRIGGVKNLTKLMRVLNFSKDIKVGASEADMHRNQSLSALNTSTPIAMAELFNCFNVDMRLQTSSYAQIATLLEQCQTGTDRLASPLLNTNSVLGHKTGTGFSTPTGGVSALNDCGYVNLKNGNYYSIAVFIGTSPYGMDETSKMIAEISRMVYDEINR